MMLKIPLLALRESSHIAKLRKHLALDPLNVEIKCKLGIALWRANCGYEAAILLRPLKYRWENEAIADDANEALAVQSWFNRNFMTFVRLRKAARPGKNDKRALKFIGSSFKHWLDYPPLLAHLGEIALNRGDLIQAGRLFKRLQFIAVRGVPRISSTAFIYLAKARQIEILAAQGKPRQALILHSELKHNPGNAMSHQIQLAELLVQAGKIEGAMKAVKLILLTARKKRNGYSVKIRERWARKAQSISPLRERKDWKSLLNNPSEWKPDNGEK